MLFGELLVGLLDVGHHRVELVEICDDRVRGHGCQDVGGQHIVGLVEVDEQWEIGSAGTDELADGLRFEAIAHLFGACLDLGQFLLRLGDLELQPVDLGLLVEHRLGRGVRPVSGVLDLTCRLFRRRLIRLGVHRR